MTHSDNDTGAKPPPKADAPNPDGEAKPAKAPLASAGYSSGRMTHSWGVAAVPTEKQVSRSRFGAVLSHVLTATGVDALRQSNWSLLASGLTIIGLASDLTQLFGEVAFNLFRLSIGSALVLGALVLFRTRYCVRCSTPFVVSCLAVVLFGGIYGGQQLMAADKKGMIATMFPQASEIQIAIYEKITGLSAVAERTEGKVDKAMQQNDQLLKEIQKLSLQLAQMQAAQSGQPVAPDTSQKAAEKLQDAIAGIATAGDEKSKSAYEALKRGDTGQAERLFQSLLDEKFNEGQASFKQAAAAASHLAAFKQLTDVASARTLYARAAELDPGNFATWINLGDMQFASGQSHPALESFKRGQSIAEKLSLADPRNAEWQRDLSVSHERIGDVRRAQGDLAGALNAYEASLAIREKLAAVDPRNAGWQRDLSVSHTMIGDVRRAQGDLAGALNAYEASLAIAEKLSLADPRNAGWQRDLSVSHNRIGDVRVAQGDLAGALNAYEASLAIAKKLAAADPRNAQWQYDLGIAHERIGSTKLSQGDLAGALSAFETKNRIVSELCKADPRNTEWQRDLSVSHNKIADVRRAQGDLAGALKAYEAGLAIAETLSLADPRNAGWQRDLSVSHNRIGDVREAQGDLAGALNAYEASLAIAETLAAADPRNTEWQRDLSVSHEKIGDVRVAQGDLAGALNAYEAGLAIAEKLAAADPRNAQWQGDLAASFGKLGTVYADMNRRDEAQAAFAKGRAIVAHLLAKSPDMALWKEYLAAFDRALAALQ